MKREWERLKAWVMMEHGEQQRHHDAGGGVGRAGYVHPDLALVDVAADPHHDDDATGVVENVLAPSPPSPPPPGRMPSSRRRDRILPENRGVVATRPISKGTVLVRIPGHLALGGRHHRGSACGSSHKNIIHSDPGDSSNSSTQDDDAGLSSAPCHCDHPSTTATATSSMSSGVSPWLECLMALYEAQQQQHEQPQLEQQVEEPSKQESGVPRRNEASASKLTTVLPPRPPLTWGPYLDTIPTHFDTLLDWTDDQLQFLKGTSLHDDHHSHLHMLDELHCRYLSHVRPRLLERRLVPNDIDAAGIDVDHTEFHKFAWACQAISTRCFHLDLSSSDTLSRPDIVASSNGASTADLKHSRSPTGPYFLPVMDLLNHSNGSDRVTTLTAVPAVHPTEVGTSSGIAYFEMVAERDVQAGEPITHSYGSSLTSAQCLQTFGFVSHEAVATMAAATMNGEATDVNSSKMNTSLNRSLRSCHTSPAIVSKNLVLKCCQRTAEHERRNRDKRIGVDVNDVEVDDDDETWELPAPDAILGRDLSSLPDHIAITLDQPLSDDLVTLLCLPFLPDDAYRELLDERPQVDDANGQVTTSALATVTSRLDASVLDDPYLGRLVGQTILEIVKDKGRTYGTIAIEGLPKEREDGSLLQELLQWEARSGGSTTSTSSYLGAMDATTRQRLTYGLTIRLEERSCLEALRREAVHILLRVTAGEVDVDYDYDGSSLDPEPTTKRQNTGSCE